MFRCFKSGNPELLGGAITSMSIAGPSAMLRSMHVMAQSGSMKGRCVLPCHCPLGKLRSVPP